MVRPFDPPPQPWLAGHRGVDLAGEPGAAVVSAAAGTVIFAGVVAGRGVVSVRSRGLWAGVDIDPSLGTGRQLCEALARRRILVKDTHGSTIRLAPPIVITEAQLDHGLDQIEESLAELS